MANKNINSKEGFTIIEVVLVLAIAGLIFLMVFVALPALQRSQRDTARRNDMSRVDTSLVQWQTNHSTDVNNLPNSGDQAVTWEGTDTLPGTNDACNLACQFVRDYMNSGTSESDKKNEFQDPNGVAYSMTITPNWAIKNSLISTATSRVVNGKTSTSNLTGNDTDGYTITGDDPFSAYVVYIVPGGRCSGDHVVKSEKRHFAILYRLEGAGVYCIDDQ